MDGAIVDEQIGIGLFAEGAAQLVERLAEVFGTFAAGFFGPEQGGQLFAAVGFAAFAHQVDKQPRRFAHAEGEGAAVERNMHLAKCRDL
ncbi:MAG: hypothetical protein IPL28_22480 [Chloroflexi bacterium]|nr:hypothetical protein [Chloroflexota bacterium]